MSDIKMRGGGCLCGAVRYSVPSQPIVVAVCHCRDCQKQTGSAFSLVAAFPRSVVSIEGDCASLETTAASGSPVTRSFCCKCGSPLFSETKSGNEAGLVFVKAGTLDETLDLAPTAHVWTASKQAWVQIPDGIYSADRE
ncbi:GFA family protein [Sphingorhabdus sp.]|uniref:GFA family protein n=1 Tax=Sphingorhabdus sp. TaxID=1902408 RepID=UPI0035B18C4D